jgi:hypothetical protein
MVPSRMPFNGYPKSRNDPNDALLAQDGKPTKYPVFQYDWQDVTDFNEHQRTLLAMGINSMIAIGPTNVWDTRLRNAQKVVVARWPDDNSIRPGPAATGNAGRTQWLADGSVLMWFDMVGLHGDDAIFRAGAHEAGHVMMGPGLPNDGHIPLSVAVAMMNEEIPEMQFDALPTGSQPTGDTMSMSGGGRLKGPVQADFDLFDHTRSTMALRLEEARLLAR